MAPKRHGLHGEQGEKLGVAKTVAVPSKFGLFVCLKAAS